MSVSLVKVPRATADDAGCWIDGHWGQYGTARLVQIAAAYGYVDHPSGALSAMTDLAEEHLASMGPSDSPGITDDEHDALMDSADEVEAWLNTYVAPTGHYFGWHDGEFFLWSDEQWEDDAY